MIADTLLALVLIAGVVLAGYCVAYDTRYWRAERRERRRDVASWDRLARKRARCP